MAALPSASPRTVDTSSATAVPCLLVRPNHCKVVLALLRASGWHPRHHARCVLNKTDYKNSWRAFQLCPEASTLLMAAAAAAAPQHPPLPPPSPAPSPAAERTSAIGLCRNFAKGHCRFGDACRLSHAAPVAATTRRSGAAAPAAVVDDVPLTTLDVLAAAGDVLFAPRFRLHLHLIDRAVPLLAAKHAASECHMSPELPRDSKIATWIATLPPQPPRERIEMLRIAATSGDDKRGPVREKDVPFTFIELFAGLGGFRVALEALGGRCILASEVSDGPRNIYALNWGRDELRGNINAIGADTIPAGFDLLTAGFPCQPFTRSGDCRAFSDPRGQLFWHVIRLARATRPKAMLLENVGGLRDVDNGRAFAAVLAALTGAGYRSAHRVYNSAEHPDVPQFRQRLFIVAVRDDMADATSFVWPDLGSDGGAAGRGRKCVLRDVLLPQEEVPARYRLTDAQWAAVSSSPYFKKNERRRLPPLDGPANTLRGSYKSGFKLYSQFVRLGDGENPRFFTPRECARLQGFPDTFRLPEDGKDEEASYTALGNAVSPPVVRVIARALLRAMRG